MRTLTFAAALACVMAASTAFGQANAAVAVPGAPPVSAAFLGGDIDVIAPARAYVKVDEAMTIRFYHMADPATVSNTAIPTEPYKQTFDRAAALLGAFGVDAVKAGTFPAADASQVADSAGKPLFKVYRFEDKKVVDPKEGAKVAVNKGEVNLSELYPDIAKGGTFVLVWKGATPLVIENLKAPLPWGALLRLRPDDQAEALKQFKDAPVNVTHIVPLQYATIKTDAGEMKAQFFYDVAPHTVDNWTSLAKQGFYDNTVFHRIIKGFMIQGGDALGATDKAGTGGPGYQISAEFNDKKHERGVLSMARSSDPNSAGSQFFIVHADSDHLNKSYTAFGKVIEGFPAMDKLGDTPAEAGSGAVTGAKPKLDSVKILPATAEMYGLKK